MALLKTVPLTGDPLIDGLVFDDSVWGEAVITYQFPTQPGYYGQPGEYGDTSDPHDEPYTGFIPFDADKQAMTEYVLQLISELVPLDFVEVPDGPGQQGVLRFGQTSAINDAGFTAWAYTPGASEASGDVWVSQKALFEVPFAASVGGAGLRVLMHEIGHALGLSHPHDESATGSVIPLSHDGLDYTVMSYKAYAGQSFNPNTNRGNGNPPEGGQPQSFMLLDIQALQHLYGANFEAHAGDTTYVFSPETGEMFINGEGQGVPITNTILRTIWDGNGVDTYDLSAYTGRVLVDLAPGAWSVFDPDQLAVMDQTGHRAFANVANAYLYQGDERSLIENVIGGAGNDRIDGNQGDNGLDGGDGRDRLAGLDGDDTLTGGAGRDYLRGGSDNDALFGGDDSDRLFGDRGADMLSGGPGGDRLAGGSGGDALYGDDGDDEVLGGGSNDALFGGAGADFIRGQLGHDRMYGEAGDDNMRGEQGRDALFGGAGADRLVGDEGEDLLDGGSGADRLIGGEGADRFVLSGAADSGQGADLRDVFADFNAAEGDMINLSGIDADTGAAGDQAFSIVGAFSGAAGQLRVDVSASGNSAMLRGDIDGDGAADFEVLVRGAPPSASDFIL